MMGAPLLAEVARSGDFQMPPALIPSVGNRFSDFFGTRSAGIFIQVLLKIGDRRLILPLHILGARSQRQVEAAEHILTA